MLELATSISKYYTEPSFPIGNSFNSQLGKMTNVITVANQIASATYCMNALELETYGLN